MELRCGRGIAMPFTGHGMAMLERVSHRVAVMHLGRNVEIVSRRHVFAKLQHSHARN
jgi:ABC-type oligopeptide transport system ATPase subunit